MPAGGGSRALAGVLETRGSLHAAGPAGAACEPADPSRFAQPAPGRLTFWNGNLELKGPEAASGVGGSALSFLLPSQALPA